MIQFLDDWHRYPKAIADFKTSNVSALHLSAKLRMMGVKNHLFFLALHDPSLQGVDPFDDNLTVEQMTAIAIECRNNPWYVFREVARAPAKAGTRNGPIEINRANICLWWSFFCHIYIILVQPRQTGKSFCSDVLDNVLMNFLCNNTEINLMTKDDKLRSVNVQRMKDIYDELPEYLKLKTKEDINNTEELSIKRLGNSYKTHVPQASEKKAHNLGRGMTTPIFKIDEAPFQSNIEIAMKAALMAMAAAVESAKRNNEPYGTVLTTTAGKIDDPDGGYIYSLVQHSAVFTVKFYDAKNQEELERMVRANCPGRNFRVYAAYTYKQLGKTDEWARDQVERAGISGDEANRDLFNIWTNGTTSNVLPTATITQMNKSITGIQYEQMASVGHYILKWYVPENIVKGILKNRKIIIGLDTSDASGGDDIAMIITDVETAEVLATGTFNETNLIRFSMWLVNLFEELPNALFIIERRSTAITIIDYLLMVLPQKGIDPFKRIFNWVVNDYIENKDRYAEATAPISRRDDSVYVRCKKYFGFATSATGATSRTELYSTTLFEAAKKASKLMNDESLVMQIASLVKRNGRVDHAPGSKDDMVIAWLLTHWLLTKANNLSFYGIDSSKIYSHRETSEEDLTLDERAELILQQRLRDRMTAILNLMKEEKDEFVMDRYESELRMLDSQMILREGEVFSLDAFLSELRNNKPKASYLAYQKNGPLQVNHVSRFRNMPGYVVS